MRNGQKKDFARNLRRTLTDAERTLWQRLRSRDLVGHKFRRQHPVGRFVVDFVCLEAGVIVEIDGGQHAGSPGDAIRTHFLEANGYLVLRFWNNDVLTQTGAVSVAILEAVTARCPHPSPLP